jgi:hypothetical protein
MAHATSTAAETPIKVHIQTTPYTGGPSPLRRYYHGRGTLATVLRGRRWRNESAAATSRGRVSLVTLPGSPIPAAREGTRPGHARVGIRGIRATRCDVAVPVNRVVTGVPSKTAFAPVPRSRTGRSCQAQVGRDEQRGRYSCGSQSHVCFLCRPVSSPQANVIVIEIYSWDKATDPWPQFILLFCWHRPLPMRERNCSLRGEQRSRARGLSARRENIAGALDHFPNCTRALGSRYAPGLCMSSPACQSPHVRDAVGPGSGASLRSFQRRHSKGNCRQDLRQRRFILPPDVPKKNVMRARSSVRKTWPSFVGGCP